VHGVFVFVFAVHIFLVIALLYWFQRYFRGCN